MSVNSVGDKNPPDKRPKRRSNSSGNINVSQAEINKIIGFNKETSSKYAKAYLDKPKEKNLTDKDKTNDLPGRSKDSGQPEENFSTSNANEIFKAGKLLPRTPPNNSLESKLNMCNDSLDQSKKVSGDPNGISQLNKRPRSGSSPASLEKNRAKRSNNNQSIQLISNASQISYSLPTEQILDEVLKALETLQKTTEIMPRDVVHPVQSALFTIHKQVTTLAFRIGQTEKINVELKHKLTSTSTYSPDRNLSPEPTFVLPSLSSKRPAFSDVLKSTGYTPATNNPTLKPDIPEWKTPPPKTKHESLIKINNQTDSRIVLQEIKKCVKATNMEGSFKRVKHLQNGAVIIECQNAIQQQKLDDSLMNKEIEIKHISNNDPMIMITGIFKGFSDKEFIKEFIAENPEITDTFGLKAVDLFKFVTKRECRNKSKENWILQTPPQLFKWLIKNNNLTFDLSPVYVQEYTNVALCFKCCLFGHVSKYCTAKECCYKCGEAHNVTECTATVNNCPNCSKLKLSDRNHTARNPNCPVFNQRIQRQQQLTNYSNDNFLAH